jgi:hypothetical protein
MASRILHCPGDPTYSHTQQFTRINCVVPTLSSERKRPRVAGLDPYQGRSGCAQLIHMGARWNRWFPGK